MVTYLDGYPAAFTTEATAADSAVGDIDTPNAATIGQDPTGQYPVSGSAYIDDLGVWTRALTPLEAESIFLAGSVNQLSFTGSGPSSNTPPTLSLSVLPGPLLDLTWSTGTLQSTTNLTGTWTNVPGATSPYTNSPTGSQLFFRVEN